MGCGEVRDRLVALQDGELAPSEAVQVREHLARCASCRALERRLEHATPRAELRVPAAVRARLEDRVNADVILTLAERRPVPDRLPYRARAVAWLGRETRVPTAAVLAYAVLLAAAVGWGVSNWWTLARLDERAAVAHDAPAVPSEIPAHQFAPAAYDPEQSSIPAPDPADGPPVR